MNDLVPDPSGLPPLCDAEEYEDLLATMVAEHIPRRFVVVQEYGCRVDARIAGWGLAHADGIDVIGADRSLHVAARSEEAVLRRFGHRGRITARIIWCDPPTPDS